MRPDKSLNSSARRQRRSAKTVPSRFLNKRFLAMLGAAALFACSSQDGNDTDPAAAELSAEQQRVIQVVSKKYAFEGINTHVTTPGKVSFADGVGSFAAPGEELWETKVTTEGGRIVAEVLVKPETYEIYEK
jgi:hypothetical protein